MALAEVGNQGDRNPQPPAVPNYRIPAFKYRDGPSETEVSWNCKELRLEIHDKLLSGGGGRLTLKPDVDAEASEIHANLNLAGNFTAKIDNSSGTALLSTTWFPQGHFFLDCRANYDEQGRVVSGGIQVYEPSITLKKNSVGRLGGIGNDFEGNPIEQNALLLFHEANIWEQTMLSYSWENPDPEKAKQLLVHDVRMKMRFWNNDSKQRAILGMGQLAKRATIAIGPTFGFSPARIRETTELLAFQGILHMPDNFSGLPERAKENPELYLDVLGKTFEDLLQHWKNYSELYRIMSTGSYNLGYSVEENNTINIAFSTPYDEIGEKPQTGVLCNGERLVWNGYIFGFNIDNGNLGITIAPNGIKSKGGVFYYPAVDRGLMLDYLSGPYQEKWVEAVKKLKPGFVELNSMSFISKKTHFSAPNPPVDTAAQPTKGLFRKLLSLF